MLAALKSAFGIKDWPEYTREEVAKHNTLDSCWIVAGEIVFDVTDFVKLHPAGPVAILKRAGGCADCKQDYKFHSKGAREQWKKFQVGVLRADEVTKPIPKGASPDPNVVKAADAPLRYTLHALEPSPTNVHSTSIERDNDGGEDCVAVGTCCRGTAPSEACKSCPNAPRCVRNGACECSGLPQSQALSDRF